MRINTCSIRREKLASPLKGLQDWTNHLWHVLSFTVKSAFCLKIQVSDIIEHVPKQICTRQAIGENQHLFRNGGMKLPVQGCGNLARLGIITFPPLTQLLPSQVAIFLEKGFSRACQAAMRWSGRTEGAMLVCLWQNPFVLLFSGGAHLFHSLSLSFAHSFTQTQVLLQSMGLTLLQV